MQMPAMRLQGTCPAKLNLTLSIVGRRPDGFHELVSLVAPVALADTLTIEHDTGSVGEDTLVVEGVEAGEVVPTGPDNLVLRAVEVFRKAVGPGFRGSVQLTLQKRIPAGSGLGGGSSDAATALDLLNELAGEPLSAEALAELAAELGSDCPLFLKKSAVILRGRGELLEALPDAWIEALRGREVLLFRPDFGIRTAWAYKTLAAQAKGHYTPVPEAEAALRACLAGLTQKGYEPSNDLAAVAFGKYLALPALLEQLRGEFGLVAQMTGSGSACYALQPNGGGLEAAAERVRQCWGPRAWVVRSSLTP